MLDEYKNKHLVTRMISAVYTTPRELYLATGVRVVTLHGWLRMTYKRLPYYKKQEQWETSVVCVAKTIRCRPADLFPPINPT